MQSNVIAVSVVRDRTMYECCLGRNPVANFRKVVLDNTSENLPIPQRYNQFIETNDYGRDSWILFCHEDFELIEPIGPYLSELDSGSLYGTVGSKRVGFCGLGFQRVYGSMEECERKDPSRVWRPGSPVRTGTVVETLDCCCLLVHASLICKYALRFDPLLEYDLYVEDFCAMARLRYGIPSRILSVRSMHHSGSRPTDRLFRHLPYLAAKYPHDCFSGTCVYFGTRPYLMRVEDWLLGRKGVSSR